MTSVLVSSSFQSYREISQGAGGALDRQEELLDRQEVLLDRQEELLDRQPGSL